MTKRSLAHGALTIAVLVGAVVAIAPGSGAHHLVASAQLIDDSGATVGEVRFITYTYRRIRVEADVRVPSDSSQFHGLHIHANDPATGCVAGTGFTGVGGHWDTGGNAHGNHTGDLPSLMRLNRGRAQLSFILEKFTLAEVVGRAVIVHIGPDNFANVPIGPATNQYTDNGDAFNGVGGTAATGNAGARYACGVITD
jgi:superoxide dismutase, Cu-Zn family